MRIKTTLVEISEVEYLGKAYYMAFFPATKEVIECLTMKALLKELTRRLT